MIGKVRFSRWEEREREREGEGGTGDRRKMNVGVGRAGSTVASLMETEAEILLGLKSMHEGFILTFLYPPRFFLTLLVGVTKLSFPCFMRTYVRTFVAVSARERRGCLGTLSKIRGHTWEAGRFKGTRTRFPPP